MTTETLREAWLGAHPYLGAVARLEEAVQRAVGADTLTPLAPPAWEAWAEDAQRGWPLLRTEAFGTSADTRLAEVLEAAVGHLRAEETALPPMLREALAGLEEVLADGPLTRVAAAQWVLTHGKGEEAPGHAGVLRLLGWTAMRGLLARVHAELLPGGAAPLWSHGHCPACGALPATAHLVEAGGGRVRLLGCGLCGSSWRYRRVGCPHCGNETPSRLEVLDVEGEPALRLDACRECHGYVKTDTGHGRDALLREDWPTLHLDALAAEHGLQRLGPTLFEV